MLIRTNSAFLRPSRRLLYAGLLLCLFSPDQAAATTVHKLIGELDPYTPPGEAASVIDGLGDINANGSGGYAARARTFPAFDNTGFGFIYGRPDAVTADFATTRRAMGQKAPADDRFHQDMRVLTRYVLLEAVRTGKPAPLEKLDQIWKVKALDPRRATSMMRELFLEVPAP